jgi:dTDP-4-amino-4,6-dideoxygalactose transaminase
VLDTPFPGWPAFTTEEIDAVSRVLASQRVNYWTGDEGRRFESEFATWCGCDHAIAVANGTLALDLALLGLGVGPGDEVVVTPRTFIASASCVVNRGATPIFADVDPNSQNITRESVETVLTPRTRAIICVHLSGWPCDMDAILDLAEEHGIYVIEDCAQAHGARYKGRSVGSLGHVAAWSFCQDKIMTTGGEGGMVTTSDRALWDRMWSLKDHGKTWSAVYETTHGPGFRWLHERFGHNWRLTEMQAAIGRIQLGRMPAWHTARTLNAERILATARDLPALVVPDVPDDLEHAWYKCYLVVDPDSLSAGWSRERIVMEINALGVPCYPGVCSEVYLEKAFRDGGLGPRTRLPNARKLGETAFMFLVHPTLGEAHIDLTCQALAEVMRYASR